MARSWWGDQEEPKGSVARAELITVPCGTDTVNRESRRLVWEPFFLKK